MASNSPPCRVTWLLEFAGHPELEHGWRQRRMISMYLTIDTAVLTVNAAANALMLLRAHMLADVSLGARLCLLINLLLSASQALLVRYASRAYLCWRTPLVCAARLVRVVVLFTMCSLTTTKSTTWLAAALQLMLQSPASASFVSAVALPLPLRPHVVLQAVVTAGTLTQARALCQRQQHSMHAERCVVLQVLSQRLQWLNPFMLHVLPWAPASGPSCCVPVVSTVTVAYGVVFSTIAVYTMDLVSRSRYLKRESQLPPATVAALVRVMRIVWLVGCLTMLSTLPIIWEVVLLAQRLEQDGLSGYGLAGLCAVATSLVLEGFMRVWGAFVLLLLTTACFVVVGL